MEQTTTSLATDAAIEDKESPETKEESNKQPTTTKADTAPKADTDKTGWSTGNLIILCTLVAFLSNALGLYLYDKYFAQKIVAIDIKGYIEEQRDLFVQGKLTSEQLRAKFDNLESVVMAVPTRKAIIMGDAVIRNVEVVKP